MHVSLPSLALLAFSALTTTSATPLVRRDADFQDVRTKLHKDMSGKSGDPPGKYFHESVFHPHYDGRFADHALNYIERKRDLSNLMQTYLSTFSDIGAETWIMHGTLLGWWWNRHILPWDSDIDAQVSLPTMAFLASYYNMTIFHYQTPRIPEGRDYLLEINPHYSEGKGEGLNAIDARWIDTESGLYIDITAVKELEVNADGSVVVGCKDGHKYAKDDIWPLRESTFEETSVLIPNKYAEVLVEEYGKKSLVQTTWENHEFDIQRAEWIPIMRKLPEPDSTSAEHAQFQQHVSDAKTAVETDPKEAKAADRVTPEDVSGAKAPAPVEEVRRSSIPRPRHKY